MDDLDTYIQVHFELERKHPAHASPSTSANDRAQTWLSTIENAPHSIEAIQTLMNTKEVEMNKVNDISEL